jgi:hypothetical protein
MNYLTMKRSVPFFSILLLAKTISAQTQIGNSDFESWETTTSETAEPVNWNSFKSASGTWASFGSQQMAQSTSVRPGSLGAKSVRIFSKSTLGVVANGNMTLGRIEMGSATASSTSNYNYTVASDPNFSEVLAEAPDSLVVWVKYTPVNSTGALARLSAVIHNNIDGFKDPNDVAGSNTVATAILNFPSIGAWERLAVPFTYVSSASNAAFINITFTTSSIPGGGAANDELLIDDLELIYNQSTANMDYLSNSNIRVFSNESELQLISNEAMIGNYNIYSASGSLVQTGDLAQSIPFKSISGVYFLHLQTEKGLLIKKFIKL